MGASIRRGSVRSVVVAIGLAAATTVLVAVAPPRPAAADPVATPLTALAGGSNGHVCAITAAGGVMCWGNNSNGQLGNGTTTDSAVPVPVSGLTSVAAVAVGFRHSCALTTAGGLKCWGGNTSGSLGVTGGSVSVPVDVTGLTSGVASVTAGTFHTCAVTTGGAAKCWGLNEDAQLGNGTTTASAVPLDVTGLSSGVTAIDAGDKHTCAVVAGAAWCWGANSSSGRLGNGTATPSSVPVPVTGLTEGVASIEASENHSCAVTTAGAAWCWGTNTNGRLGSATIASGSSSPVPVAVTGLSSGVAAVRSTTSHTCAVMVSGAVLCWGAGGQGQLGRSTMSSALTPQPAVKAPAPASAIATTDDGTCALSSAGSIRCWGYVGLGQQGNGRYSRLPIATGQTDVASVVSATDHSCALTTAGGVRCWGTSESGKLGDGSGTWPSEPVEVAGLSSGVTALALGRSHTCAITTGGGLKCWGNNSTGQLGDGSTTNSSVPVDVPGLTSGVVSVSAGVSHTCAVTDSGGAKCWGANATGQLGDGTQVSSLTPVDVSGLTSDVRSIAAGALHTCAVTTSGGALCWGENGQGMLGNGTITRSLVPVGVSGLGSGVEEVTVTKPNFYFQVPRVDGNSCARLTSGAVKCWGNNRFGQLGNGSTTTSLVPVDVVGLGSGVTHLATSYVRSCAVVNGAAKCWGYSGTGGLGGGGTASSSVPVQVAGLTEGIAGVASGGRAASFIGAYYSDSFSCAVSSGGELWCWGELQLGITATADVDGGAIFLSSLPPAPTIAGERSPAANADGWNNEPVHVTFTCSSSSLATCTAPVTVASDGADQAVSGTATDTSGQSASTSVGGISIDRVAPTLAGTATTSPNAAGWYRSPVTMGWTCDDALSGIAPGACPSASATVGEGTAVSVVGSVVDRAGNLTTASSEAVQVDLTAPSTGVSSLPTWADDQVTLTLTASDALSGVATTSYRIDGGPVQTGTAPVVVGDGLHSVSYWSSDLAGNEETPSSVTVAIDVTAPSITSDVSPPANGAGWHDGPVEVTFTCEDATSGVASCVGDASFVGEVDTTVTGTATDNAGNTASAQATVRIDQTAPTVTALVPVANGFGWFNAEVQVPFSCADTGGSGIASCPAPRMFAGQGAAQEVTGTATDNAGNEGSASGASVSIDLTLPTITGAVTTAPNSSGGYYGPVTVDWTCADALSGVVSCPADEVVTGEGVHTLSASVSDRAGNTASADVTLRIDHDPATDPGIVRGTITDATSGLPVKGAMVGLVAATPQVPTLYSIKTGTDGSYTFPAVADGRYQLYVNNYGSHLQAWYPNATRSVDAQVLVVAHGDVVVADQALTRGHALSGQLTSQATGLPVSGATVRVTGGGVSYTATSDALGRYAVTGMVPGSRTVTFTAFGFVPVSVPQSITGPTTLDRALPAAAIASSGIKGTITALTPGGAPLGGATVRLWVKDSTTIAVKVTTAANGRFVLPNLPVGSYEIDVLRNDYRSRWFGDSVSRSTAATIVVDGSCAVAPDPSWGDPCATVANLALLRP